VNGKEVKYLGECQPGSMEVSQIDCITYQEMEGPYRYGWCCDLTVFVSNLRLKGGYYIYVLRTESFDAQVVQSLGDYGAVMSIEIEMDNGAYTMAFPDLYSHTSLPNEIQKFREEHERVINSPHSL